MTAKYYTHFVTASGAARRRAHCGANEWSGVVELRHPLEPRGGTRELRTLLAQSFDVASEDIRILQWARLH